MSAAEHFKSRERETRTILTSGQYGIVRLDGKAFHSYTRGLDRPYDQQFMDDMDSVAIDLVRSLGNVRLAYVQSDEISLLLTDWRGAVSADVGESKLTEFPFGGQVQKLVSISAAMATAKMNALRYGVTSDKVALFDSRAFSLPTRDEAVRYLVWRQRDAAKNSVSMTASVHFSDRQLHGVSTRGRQAMLADIGVDPDAVPDGFRRGRVILREEQPGSTVFRNKRTGEESTAVFTRMVPVSRTAPLFDEDDSMVPGAPRGALASSGA